MKYVYKYDVHIIIISIVFTFASIIFINLCVYLDISYNVKKIVELFIYTYIYKYIEDLFRNNNWVP